MLDKTREYQEVFGKPGVSYTQDDKLYNGMEIEVDWSGNILEEANKTVSGPKKAESEPEKESVDTLTWEDQPESAESKADVEEDPAEFELIDRIKVKSRSNPLYLKKAEVKAELDKQNVEYSAKESRDDLLARLKDHLGV